MDLFVEKKLPDYARSGLRGTKSRRRIMAFGVALIIGFVAATWWQAPANFPKSTLIAVSKGQGLSSIAKTLKAAHIIRSEFWFKGLVVISGGSRGAQAGDYNFDIPQNIFVVADRIARGVYNLKQIKVTIPEGLSNLEVAKIFSVNLPRFNSKEFLNLAKSKEGYLFPDTYWFLPNVSGAEIISAMSDNFDKQIISITDQIQKFGKPLNDVIIMASIIEEEARIMETRQTIAGILWKRLKEGMLLQVDAPFSYINGQALPKVYLDDLKIDSPYNTYLYKGLPPGPIANPGLDAIKATINPVATKYYYYLTDKDGVMHYAVTHDEHVANKNLYLK
ncbi:MAG: endolytic transglycosylase MltG [Candidatus Paceibacterota bacterium]